MKDKKDSVVLSLRTKYGENLLGYYVGDSINKVSELPTVVLYRPIRINYIEYVNQGKMLQNYEHTFYFPFGGPLVEVLQADIINSDTASDFFSFYYAKILGEEIVNEERLQNRIISFYEHLEIRDILKENNTDSFYIKPLTEYLN